tara:strand:+ start:1456 stop:1851 length:396 start_codon:yes stop_codon:yes gene_type:complete
MKKNYIKNILISFLALFIIFTPIQISDALSPNWIRVPKSQYGEQLWDKNSIQTNQDGSLRVLSKYIPKRTSEITESILYTMDIKCSENSFRDVSVGTKELNKSNNKDLEWQNPDGDKLILGVIDQVCAFSN